MDRILQTLAAGVDAQLGVQRFVVGTRNARELLDQTCSGFGIKPFGVPLLAGPKISVEEDLEEITWLCQCASTISILLKWR